MTRLFTLLLALAVVPGHAFSQEYSTPEQLGQRLKALESANPSLAKLQSLTKTAGGKDIWVLEIGSGDPANHPAIAIIGGVEGYQLLGQELAIGFAERLLSAAQKDSIKTLLASTTFYIFPCMSPDASAQYFASLKFERSANATPTDDDRDGKMNEDPFDDLNKDGVISWVRIEDPTGKWKKHSADERVMVLANTENGEQGKYIVFQEGIDNDKDGKWNEDPEGGVHFNKSLTYDPPYFAAGAGEHPVSEPENRALLDYLYERFNVFAVVTFGPANNLSEPWKFDKSKTTQRIITGILENDARVNKMVSELYKKTVATKDPPAAAASKGDLVQWAYFHYGRQSFSTPGWCVPKFELPKDSTAAKKIRKNEDKNTDVDFLRWAEKEGLDVLTPWQKINHPDYPEKNAEVGGIKPFVKFNPPFKLVSKLIDDHSKFLVSLAIKRPEIVLVDLKTEPLENGVTRISVTLQNKGLFPAVSDIALNNYWIKLVKVQMSIRKDQKMISGNKITILPNIGAGETKELTWLIQGKGKVTIEAGAPQTGIKTLDATL
jgi:Zinc carboxypeptidase